MNKTNILDTPRINRIRAQQRQEKLHDFLACLAVAAILLLVGIAGSLSQTLGLQ